MFKSELRSLAHACSEGVHHAYLRGVASVLHRLIKSPFGLPRATAVQILKAEGIHLADFAEAGVSRDQFDAIEGLVLTDPHMQRR